MMVHSMNKGSKKIRGHKLTKDHRPSGVLNALSPSRVSYDAVFTLNDKQQVAGPTGVNY